MKKLLITAVALGSLVHAIFWVTMIVWAVCMLVAFLASAASRNSRISETHAGTYQAMKAVAGLAPSIDGRNRKGLIDQIRGNTNKEGFFQNRIISISLEIGGIGEELIRRFKPKMQ